MADYEKISKSVVILLAIFASIFSLTAFNMLSENNQSHSPQTSAKISELDGEFELVLVRTGDDKIAVIKLIKAITGMSLIELK